ncbi:Motility protein B [Aquicella siphonis]|uniref:Motility protein B n=1 Tax=Aquicella siphonis TaxID=254247 RepID=A0A5E4PLD9_9COXI|nr:flagellar motor protein MotB [Aquicella siphonis]VVC77082.1 Motility protein B [Aquicella siphonis]
MDDENKRAIIVKRIKKVHNTHHGGSWKIAYADFVTAMMSFFLLMWLLSMLNKYQLQGIAEYFKKPLKEVFSKQDNISRTNTLKPDKLGPSTYKETGLKEKTENTADKNLGVLDKAQNQSEETQGNPQNPVKDMKDQQDTSGTQKHQSQKEQLEKLMQMKAELETKMKNDPEISQFKNQLNFVVTSDGLKIIINDLKNKPMFSLGKTDFEKYAKNILAWLSKQITVYPNKVMIIGHTDTIPYPDTANYGNWELSADRANATRRALIKYGVNVKQILRVVGGADTDSLENLQGDNPANRRIEIILLTDQAAEHMQNL